MGNKIPLGYRKCTSLSSAIALSDSAFTDGTNTGIPDGAQVAYIQALDKNVRWRDDGGTPTASAGMQLVAGDTLVYDGPLAKLKVIQEAASATLLVSFYRQ